MIVENGKTETLEGILDRDIDRRGFLKCMQWAGAGVVWSLTAGVPTSRLLGAPNTKAGDFSFVQISDSHIGFDKAANPGVTGTFQTAVDRINALDEQPDLVIHTGDLSHLAKASEFDTLDQLLQGLRQKQIFFVPGEHDLLGDDGKQYMERFGKGTVGRGWQSFEHKGVHFIGLNNSAQLEGMGAIGEEQMAWLKRDLAGLRASTPIVVFAHIPLWAAYHECNWENAVALKVLLVEDSRTDAWLTTRALKLYLDAVEVTHLTDGEAAMEAFQDLSKFDLVILDLNLPKIDAFEIMKQNTNSAVPIIVLTSSTDPAHRAHAAEIGAVGFISKSLNLSEYNQNIRSAVERWHRPAH